MNGSGSSVRNTTSRRRDAMFPAFSDLVVFSNDIDDKLYIKYSIAHRRHAYAFAFTPRSACQIQDAFQARRDSPSRSDHEGVRKQIDKGRSFHLPYISHTRSDRDTSLLDASPLALPLRQDRASHAAMIPELAASAIDWTPVLALVFGGCCSWVVEPKPHSTRS